ELFVQLIVALILSVLMLLFEVFPRVEAVRLYEMKQGPQLLEGVLQRGAGDEEAMVGVEFEERFVQEGIVVLETMCLVNRKHGPVHIVQEDLQEEGYFSLR